MSGRALPLAAMRLYTQKGRRCGRPLCVQQLRKVYRLSPVLFGIYAPPGRDRMVVPPNAEAWSLEASFAVVTCDGEIRITQANKGGHDFAAFITDSQAEEAIER